MIALLGGTFDPIHIGHLRAASEAAQALDAEVRLIPAKLPPHRPQPEASAGQRLDMLRIALSGSTQLSADDRELRREGPSYSVDTLAELRLELGARQCLALMVGADAFAGFSTWHRWLDILELAHIVVLNRPGAATVKDWPASLNAQVAARHCADAAALRMEAAGRVLMLDIPALAVSATSVRESLARGSSVRWLVPDPVLEYIAQQGLYRGGRGG
jgi:nicotinate-nucleotide adenylyltransferase